MIDVVEDADLALVGVLAIKAPGVLRHRAAPRDRHREHERVQARVVEALADVAAGGQHDARLVAGEQLLGAPAGANAHPAVQRHELRCRVAQEGGECVEVRAALGQHERETPCGQLGQDVVGDPARALWIGRDRPEDLLDVRVGRQGRGIEVRCVAR